jgi:putative addiction module component (TIGR02574 family)
MDRTTTLAQIRQMSVDDRIWLVQEIWDSIADDGGPPLTDAQKAELDRRVADMEAHPDDEVPWEQVHAEAMNRMSR